MDHMGHLAYRKELDGLRAIAVISVVLFHLGYRDLTGGFVGVDIFFVLSGYLICGQTYLRLRDQNYSATEFFARRIRRLSSAYFACFFVTGLIANALFLRSELDVVFSNLLGSTTFTNNFNLLNSQGYFGKEADENPFLHTWSLSIEEQFYIVLPVLILLTRRSLSVFKATLVILFVLSLAMMLFSGEAIYTRDQRFFSSAFRVWELALGGLIFMALDKRGGPITIPFAPIIGIALVLVPVGMLDGTTLYPGPATLVPTIGTAILVATMTPATGFTGRVLASPVMAYIGRISYGTYLWHWPMIVFVLYVGVDLNDVIRAGLFFVSLLLGAMSYHLIEMPIRRMDVVRNKWRLFALFGVQTFALLVLSGVLYQQSQKPDALSEASVAQIKAEDMNAHPGWNVCWGRRTSDTFCQIGDVASNVPDFVVWGDSMANSAYWAFETYARQTGQSGFLVPSASCAPLEGIARDFSGSAECLETNRQVLEYLDQADPMDVFIFARWSYYAEGYRNHESTTAGQIGLVDADNALIDGDEFAEFKASLERTLDRIGARHRVIVINQVPVFPYSVPKMMLREARFGKPPEVKTTAAFLARSGRTVDAVRGAARSRNAILIEPHLELCRDGECAYEMDGIPIYFDQVHLSSRGNKFLSDLLKDALDNQ